MARHLFPGRSFGAFLFDMDGTILSSIAATERVWTKWALSHKLDAAAVLPTIHGVRAIETVRRLDIPGVDVMAEVQALTLAELADLDGIEPIAGAIEFLAALPADRWAVVTSAPRELAMRRIAAAGMPPPPMMVAGDDVASGKPAPDCFLLAAEKLGQRPQDCLVFEDAVAGIQAAEAAGSAVMVITATHRHRFDTPHPAIAGYDKLFTRHDAGGIVLSAARHPEIA
jgi:sugar-phosphatase